MAGIENQDHLLARIWGPPIEIVVASNFDSCCLLKGRSCLFRVCGFFFFFFFLNLYLLFIVFGVVEVFLGFFLVGCVCVCGGGGGGGVCLFFVFLGFFLSNFV